jgi:hypothetical protein
MSIAAEDGQICNLRDTWELCFTGASTRDTLTDRAQCD